MGQKDYTVKPCERQTVQAAMALQMINIGYNHHHSLVMIFKPRVNLVLQTGRNRGKGFFLNARPAALFTRL
jgi:hypothetical protein